MYNFPDESKFYDEFKKIFQLKKEYILQNPVIVYKINLCQETMFMRSFLSLSTFLDEKYSYYNEVNSFIHTNTCGNV